MSHAADRAFARLTLREPHQDSFNAGWNASIDFAEDVRKLRSESPGGNKRVLGAMLLIFGVGIFVTYSFGMIYSVPMRVSAIPMGLVALILSIFGIKLWHTANKIDNNYYRKFKEKWG